MEKEKKKVKQKRERDKKETKIRGIEDTFISNNWLRAFNSPFHQISQPGQDLIQPRCFFPHKIKYCLMRFYTCSFVLV